MCDLTRVWPEAKGSRGWGTSRCFLLSCSPDKTFLVTQNAVLLFRMTQKTARILTYLLGTGGASIAGFALAWKQKERTLS